MSEPHKMQEQNPEKAEEVTKKSSVYELPSLPVEFPPKDDGEGLMDSKRTVTFEVQVKVKFMCAYYAMCSTPKWALRR